MSTNEIIKREKRKFNREKRRESFLRKWTLFRTRLLNEKLRYDDTRTIQVHKDLGGMQRDYYIKDEHLRNESSFNFVNVILEDYANNIFIYK